MAPSFPRIQAASTDGRLHNVYHRQVQLEKLCKALIDNVQEIKTAISTDYDYSAAEIATEYHLTLNEIKRVYSDLKPKDFHEDEYLIANNKDASMAKKPVGIVYIEPTQYNLFYSSLVPLSTAFAAGNCVIILLENNLRAVTSLLRRILQAALDADTFAVASSPITDSLLLSKALCVFQNGAPGSSQSNQLTSYPTALTVAVVDRTADVHLAARELVSARFAFEGHSPYAPDYVLVNEFVKQEFLQAVKSQCDQLASKSNKANTGSGIDDKLSNLRKVDSSIRTIVQEANFAVVDISSRAAAVDGKIHHSILRVHGIKSADDAIDLANESSSNIPHLAAYHFGSLAMGKYLSQFIDAEVSFVNHVPREILVGPAAPSGHTFQPSVRYPVDLFSAPRPAYVHCSDASKRLADILSADGGVSSQQLLNDAAMPLAEFKRNPGGGVGFFEQGFLISAGIIVLTTLTASATGMLWLWRWSRPI